jgi:hypothetical protein
MEERRRDNNHKARGGAQAKTMNLQSGEIVPMPYDVLDTTRELIERAGRLRKRTTSFCQITVTNTCPAE